MEVKRIQVEHKEWAIIWGDKTIPMSVIGGITKLPFLMMLIAVAYNIGQQDALEYMKWIAAFHGACDKATGQCQECFAYLSGTRVEWICEFQNKTPANWQQLPPDIRNLTFSTH